MIPKPRNIIIFVAIGAALILIYIFFIKSSPNDATSLTEQAGSAPLEVAAQDPNSAIAEDFLSLLLSIKTIKLDDTIFSDPVFNNLHDTPIDLSPDGTEGRPNPFAPIGNDIIANPVNNENPGAPASPSPSGGSSVPPLPPSL